MRLPYFIEQLLFPSKVSCNLCGKEEQFRYGICYDCYNLLEKPQGDRCQICMDKINTEGLCSACFHKKPDYTRLYCAYVYKAPLRTLILGLKNGNKRYLKYSFAEIAKDTVEVMDKITLITTVPSSKKRLRQRRYNHTELISMELSKLTDIPYKNVLVRTSDAKTALMNKAERLKNIKGQYSFSESVFGETVLLVDDVCTTGSTLRECSKALKKAGAKEVFCFTVARTEPKF